MKNSRNREKRTEPKIRSFKSNRKSGASLISANREYWANHSELHKKRIYYEEI